MIEYEKIIDQMAQSLFEMFNGKANGLTVDHFKLAAANSLFSAMEHHQSPDYPKHNTLHGYFDDKYRTLGEFMNSKKLTIGC